mgnify:CR=1 FL=1
MGTNTLILTGEPGIGKSAFSAQLAHRNKLDVLAAVFIRYNQPQTFEPSRVICTLAYQLACRLPDYRTYLMGLAELDELDKKNESELFSYLMAEPLRLCIDGNRNTGIIILDALDETSGEGTGLPQLLARYVDELPKWIKVVATTRPEPQLLSVLSSLHPVKIGADDSRNRQDIAEYLCQQLVQFNPDAETIERIVTKSEGIFLYAQQVAEQVKDSTFAPR